MPFNLTANNANVAYNSSGKFGSSLSAYGGTCPNPTPTNGTFTVEGWIKTPDAGTKVAFGAPGTFWVGVNGGKAQGHYGSGGSEVTIESPTAINDNAHHHARLVVDASGGKFFIDGVLVGSNPATAAAVGMTYTSDFGIGTFAGLSQFDWFGEIDEVAFFSTALSSASFTPPSAPYANNTPGLVALWHLDGNLTDSREAPAADTTKPTASSAAVANGSPSVVAITMSEAMDGAYVPAASAFTVGGHAVSSVSVSGTVISLTCATPFVNGEAARTVAYVQPGANQARDVAGNVLDSFSGLAITNNVQAAGDTTPPAFASAQVVNSQPAQILVTMNETLAASVPPNSAFTPSGGRTVTGVSVSGAVATVTVNTPYANGDTISIAYTKPGANPRLQDASGNPAESFGAQSVTNNIAAPASNLIAPNDANWLWSPGNWKTTAAASVAVNGGAYGKISFTGTSITLKYDSTGTSNGRAISLRYSVDNGPQTDVALAINNANGSLVLGNLGGGNHTLEFTYQSGWWEDIGGEADDRWTNPTYALRITGATLDSGASTVAVPRRPKTLLWFGDSISEGIRANNSDVQPGCQNGYESAPMFIKDALDAELGNCSFGGQNYTTGFNSIPAFNTSYASIFNGASRLSGGLFSPMPDYIAVWHGANGGVGQNEVQAAIANLRAAAPGKPIFMVVPVGGFGRAGITAGVNTYKAANPAETNVFLIDLGPAWGTGLDGFGNATQQAIDRLHPRANWNARIASAIAVKMQAALDGVTQVAQPALTARTVTVTLKDANGPCANLTGLKVSFHDEPTPDLASMARFQAANETTDAGGVLTFQVQSTLGSGGTGHLTVLGAAGVHYNGSVAVA